jgi:MFS family permease
MEVLRRDLRASSMEGAAASVMVGAGETYFPAFVLAASGSQLACGLVTTVPLVLGALLQLAAPAMLGRLRSYRRWVALCAGLQAATFVLLAWGAVRQAFPLALIFVLVAVYWGTGLGGGPAWNAWMETLVPARIRARYFGWRTCAVNWGVAAGFAAGGVLLQVADDGRHLFAAFAVLFLAAAASRVVSTSLLTVQREASRPPQSLPRPLASGIRYFLTQAPNRRLLLYLLAAQAAVQVAGPYFNPYILGHLKFSYCTYMLLMAAAYVGRILFLPALGRLAARWGTQRLFWTSALLIVPLPALWLVSSNIPWLLVMQVSAGGVWAAYELTTLLLFFETIPRGQRVPLLTLFNLANAAATAGGSLLGGVLLTMLGGSAAAYATLFVLSAVARAVALALLSRAPVRAPRAAPMPHRRPSAPRRVEHEIQHELELAGSR